MSMQGKPSINHHCCASSVVTAHDFEGDEHLEKIPPGRLLAFAVDESGNAWWARVLSVVSAKKPNGPNRAATVKLRVTAPHCFTNPVFPASGELTITLWYPPTGFRADIPVSVEYVDDNGCW